MTKSIGYAYPSSDLAEKYNHGFGCYLIELLDGYNRKGIIGPFSNIKIAETTADKDFPDLDYWEIYKKYPLRDSKFFLAGA